MISIVWRPVVGLESRLEVSNTGLIRTVPRKFAPYQKILGFEINRHGYYRVQHLAVHRLVAKAFLPNSKNLPQVNHKDGDKSNNHVDNLEWCTSQYNNKHAFRTGIRISKKGEDWYASKLTEKQVLEIRSKYIPYKYTMKQLAEEYGLKRQSIWSIIRRKNWKHI